ncbi:hypothetical protein GCM10022291_30540 [Postechiella marina]|uniref:Uncharacterized protein n=1 Tax=Postechiella marina TaxID=943941 RepID=A0ABP8CFS6_9FLAO
MKKIFVLAIASSSLFFATSCKIDQEKKTELPDVDLDIDASVEEGQLPSFDVDWADVNVGTEKRTVKVPKVVVVMDEVEVDVPYIDIDMPKEFGNKEEHTIMVEAEVNGFEHEINIEKIYASNNNLIVVSELEKGETSLGDKKMRISDQITINAPDLNVKHYIIGEKPNRLFNNAFKYYANEKDLKSKLENYRVIYSD